MKTTVRILTVAALLLAAGTTFADPLDGQVLKFEQQPMVQTFVEGIAYYGHDEESTVYNGDALITGDPGHPLQYPLLYSGNYVADDFADRSTMPVVHVQWWGSYLPNANPDINTIPIKKFLISFETDVPDPDPDDPSTYSHPGNPILNQVVELDTSGVLTAGSGKFTERWIHPGGAPLNEALYVYNAELALPFEQDPDTIYWLKIAAMVDMDDFNGDHVVDLLDLEYAPRWGWHNRDYTKPNPLASTPSWVDPSAFVDPGEDVVGNLNDGTQVWHFQDDAVANSEYSRLEVTVHDPVTPFGVEVNQLFSPIPDILPNFEPQSYLPGVDGPDEIRYFSKDLAFALYAPVPEPSSIVMIGMAAVCLLLARWRRKLL